MAGMRCSRLSEKIRCRSTELGTVRQHNEPRVLLPGEISDSLLDCLSVPTFYRNGLNAETRCGSLDSLRQFSEAGVIWVEEDANALYRRSRLCKRFPPISGSNVLN